MDIRATLLISTYNNPRLLDACLRSVARQRVMPCEVLVADDGSTAETAALIESWRERIPVPLRHIRHEDRGWRLGMIRNKAIALATGEYVIQVCGDQFLGRRFVQDHLRAARPGTFVCGSRVEVGRTPTRVFLKRNRKWIPPGVYLSSWKALRIPFLSAWISALYRPSYQVRIEGGNMAFWREDLLRLNAYDEGRPLPGLEEWELSSRLAKEGINPMPLRLRALCFHLDHPVRVRHAFLHLSGAALSHPGLQPARCDEGVDKWAALPAYASYFVDTEYPE